MSFPPKRGIIRRKMSSCQTECVVNNNLKRCEESISLFKKIPHFNLKIKIFDRNNNK